MPKRKTLARVFAQTASIQLDIIDIRLPGAMAGTDAEELHQFRVAVRKTRAYLRLLHKHLPDALEFAAEFGWLAHATNAMRDIDVLTAQVRQAGAATPDAGVVAMLEAERQRELARLRRVLRSARCCRLLQTWRRYLLQLPDRDDLSIATRIPARLVLRCQWLRQCRSVLRRGDLDALDAPDVVLHKLRIRCKRLRYFGEAFEPQLRKRGRDHALHALKSLQDLLGAHRDAVVAVGLWRRLARRVGDLPQTVLIVSERIALAEQQQESARAGYAQALQAFAIACTRLH